MAEGIAFREGEPALLFDDKGRKYLLHLRSSSMFRYHRGNLAHADIIGRPEGARLVSSNGAPLIAVRPRLADYILKMKRGPQVVYPKDLGPILVHADIRPGLTVVEAGTGSGAATLALARAVGPTGRLISCELREDHAARGRATVERYFGAVPEWLDLRVGDVREVAAKVDHDRLFLDLPEPWDIVPAAAGTLRPGGLVAAYVPTVPQLGRIHAALAASDRFLDVETFEVLLRTWHVAGRSVRPDHGMVGHTGFVTTARCISPA